MLLRMPRLFDIAGREDSDACTLILLEAPGVCIGTSQDFGSEAQTISNYSLDGSVSFGDHTAAFVRMSCKAP
jgi:hypothetical protein